MKIYVASSWRNERQPTIIRHLRDAGHEVYDFRNPEPGNYGFHWSEIDPDWKKWSPPVCRDLLNHPIVCEAFRVDMDALRWCDAVVAVQPFGQSASLELGWAVGAGKLTILLLARGEPELMIKMCDHICIATSEVIAILRKVQGD